MGVRIELWSDGSGTTSGPGGWAYVLRAINTITGEVLDQREGSGGMLEATNNRAELTAVLMGLTQLTKPAEVHVFSDSEYVVNAVAKGWLRKWADNGWQKSSKPKPDDFMLECPVCFKPTDDDVCVYHGHDDGRPGPVATVTRTSTKHVVNRDLWIEMLAASSVHRLHFNHVPGHAGVELNERCDTLAGDARRAVIERLAPVLGESAEG